MTNDDVLILARSLQSIQHSIAVLGFTLSIMCLVQGMAFLGVILFNRRR